ncbi:MAG: hypothetical protein RL150_563 [Candidatus Parcubacteria bacterium]|jgi:formamidopyrimidine-DNA glycosylase
MPELPEVHTTATELRKLVVGKTIADVWGGYNSPHYYGKEQVKDPVYFKTFKKEVIGTTITDTGRVGKNVLIHLNTGKTILVHMKMTGHLLYGVYTYSTKQATWFATEEGPLRDDPWNGFIRLVFSFSDGTHLALSDLRKFAKVTLLSTNELETHPDLAVLGPDPLEQTFSYKIFSERLKQRPRTPVKQALMDQTLIAGVGNIYSDEALWLAGINPHTPVAALSPAEMKKLFTAVQNILKTGIDFRGDSTSDYRTPNGLPGAFQHEHQVYRRTKKPCTKKSCTGTINRSVIGGRSAHYCPTCQPSVTKRKTRKRN